MEKSVENMRVLTHSVHAGYEAQYRFLPGSFSTVYDWILRGGQWDERCREKPENVELLDMAVDDVTRLSGGWFKQFDFAVVHHPGTYLMWRHLPIPVVMKVHTVAHDPTTLELLKLDFPPRWMVFNHRDAECDWGKLGRTWKSYISTHVVEGGEWNGEDVRPLYVGNMLQSEGVERMVEEVERFQDDWRLAKARGARIQTAVLRRFGVDGFVRGWMECARDVMREKEEKQ